MKRSIKNKRPEKKRGVPVGILLRNFGYAYELGVTEVKAFSLKLNAYVKRLHMGGVRRRWETGDKGPFHPLFLPRPTLKGNHEQT